MKIRYSLTAYVLLFLVCAGAQGTEGQWAGPSLHPKTERVAEHIPVGYDPAQVIPMILCPDAKYLPHAGVTITSLLENANCAYAYDIYIISDHKLSGKEKVPWLELAEQYGASVQFNLTLVDGKDLIEDSQTSGGHWGQTALYRLMAPEMDIFAQYDKLIYIDCDMIVYDIAPFWTQTLELEDGEEAWFAAVHDLMPATPSGRAHLLSNLIPRAPHLESEFTSDSKKYINSGLLLMNLKEFRLNKFTSAALDFIKTKHPVWPDQDAINILAFKKLKRLDFKYAYPYALTHSKPKGIFALHYSGNRKPWHMHLPSGPGLISSLSDYHFYRQKSPWKMVQNAPQSTASRVDHLLPLKKWRSRKLQAQGA